MVKNQGTKQRVHRSPGDCWQWETNGKCSIDIAESFSKIFYAVECEKMHRKPEVVEAEAQVGKWLDCRARITSKEFAPIHYVKNGTLQSVCSTSQTMYTNVGEKCSCAHRQVDEQPSRRSKKNGDKNAVVVLKITRHLGCISQDMDPPKSSSTTVITADGEVQTHEEATVYVKELVIFLTMKVLKDTSAVQSSGMLFDEHGCS